MIRSVSDILKAIGQECVVYRMIVRCTHPSFMVFRHLPYFHGQLIILSYCDIFHKNLDFKDF